MNTTATPVFEDHLPYPVRSELNQIEPRLDVFWQERLLAIFRSLDAGARVQAAEQILRPKAIIWNAEHKQFEYRPQTPQSDTLPPLPNDAPKKLRILANFLQENLASLHSEHDAHHIAALLESAFEQAEAVKTDNNLQWQLYRCELQEGYIFAAAHIIRAKSDIALPPLRRKLNTPAIKTFINEVFLKQQLLGYAFKTQRSRQLAQMPHELISGYLRTEQRQRRLEVVRASKYLFALAPSLDGGINPFNLRRFLHEEMLYEQLLLNGVAVNTALLANSGADIQDAFKKQVSCIITIESGISRAIIEFVEGLQNYLEDVLLPALFARPDGNLAWEQAVAKHLAHYERLLAEGILQPLAHTLRKRVSNAEEHDYLQLSMRQLLGDLISTFKDFQSLPGMRTSAAAHTFYGRLVAYAVFLEKRRGQVFILQSAEDWQRNHAEMLKLRQDFQQTAQSQLAAYGSLKEKADALRGQLAAKPSLLDKLFKKQEKLTQKLEETEKQARQIRYAVHDKIYHLPENWREQIVNLEFDAQLINDGEQRHYALADGDNGIAQLPLVVSLAERRTEFDLEDFLQQLD